MGLSASQCRLLLLTARRSDLEYRAQQISQKRLILSQQLEEISLEYEEATTNRQMKFQVYLNGKAKEDGENNPSRQVNLTYAAFVSGCAGYDPSRTGIQPSGVVGTDNYMDDGSYASMAAYRLVNADGAIVVADYSEIPSSVVPTAGEEAARRVNENDNDKVGIYQTTDDNDGITTSLLAGGDMLKAIFGDNPTDGANKEVMFSETPAPGVIKYTDADGNDQYYSISEGKKYANGLQDLANGSVNFKEDKVKLYAKASDLPSTKVKQDTVNASHGLNSSEYSALPAEEKKNGVYIVKGNDGLYTLYEFGVQKARYVVDETLNTGYTDVYGSQDGPNYLQDCIRNGKYLIQQYKVDKNKDDGYKWSQVSWDALATIHDGYYTEDDDAAKAKYDRLQNEIQAQDKKLELELDQIETQRQAVTTEIESVDKVKSENIEKTFNAFG